MAQFYTVPSGLSLKAETSKSATKGSSERTTYTTQDNEDEKQPEDPDEKSPKREKAWIAA